MVDYSLPAQRIGELRAAHRRTRDKREADRIKAVVLLASGRTAEDVAEALLIDPNTVRNHVYKKPKLVPGKADRQAQEAFLDTYQELKENRGEDDVILFMDAVHPQHNPVLGYGWIKRGEDREVPSNTGRRRLNINGAVDLERLEPVVRYDDTIDAASTIALFDQLLLAYAYATCIYLICDNARYYRSKVVQEYLQNSRIKLVFLPAYAPNLNLIERLWKFFKKQVLYNRYCETFGDFRAACEDFFDNPKRYRAELRSLLTENFAIIG